MEVPRDAHPRVREIRRYWTSIAPGPRLLPGRAHFDPVDVPSLLPNIWLIDVVRDPLRFRYRLLGTTVEKFAGRRLTGLWLDRTLPAGTREEVIANLTEVVETGTPSWRRGPSLIVPEKTVMTLERLYLPLASDGRTVDMVLGLTIFELQGDNR